MLIKSGNSISTGDFAKNLVQQIAIIVFLIQNLSLMQVPYSDSLIFIHYLQYFKNTGCSLSRAHAHRDHTIFFAPTFQFMKDLYRKLGPCAT